MNAVFVIIIQKMIAFRIVQEFGAVQKNLMNAEYVEAMAFRKAIVIAMAAYMIYASYAVEMDWI